MVVGKQYLQSHKFTIFHLQLFPFDKRIEKTLIRWKELKVEIQMKVSADSVLPLDGAKRRQEKEITKKEKTHDIVFL